MYTRKNDGCGEICFNLNTPNDGLCVDNQRARSRGGQCNVRRSLDTKPLPPPLTPPVDFSPFPPSVIYNC